MQTSKGGLMERPADAMDVSMTSTSVYASGLELTFSAALDDTESLEQLGPIIKQITETGKQGPFLKQLENLIRKKDDEIKRICYDHYEEFIRAVEQLIEIHKDADSLRGKIGGVNNEIQTKGKALAAKKLELLQARKEQQNVEAAIEALEMSLSVLELANKANSELEPQKYYSALKTLENLEHGHLGNVSQYSYAKLLAEDIQLKQSKIQDDVTAELKGWLASMRDKSRHLGASAMKRMQDRQERWHKKKTEDEKLKNQQHHNVNSAVEMVINEGLESSILDEIPIDDFEPLFRCIHVHDVLGKRHEFKKSYEEDRRAQANLALSVPINLRDGNMSAFEALLQNIVGFFIVEHAILRITREFRNQSEVDALWEMVTGRVITVVSDSLKVCRDPDLFLKIKFSLLLFIQTLEGFDFTVKPLQERLVAVFQRYSELLINRYSDEFEKIVEQDECMPMTVYNEKELETITEYTLFKPDRNDKSYGFPIRLPFSEVFPTCCRDVSEFVRQFYQFTDGFPQKHGEMDDILKQAVDNLLINKVNAILLKKLRSTNLSQVAQIIVNIEYFEEACPVFEKLLEEERSFHRSGHIELKATSTFKQTRKKAEKRVFEVVNSKLDDFLELSDFDWEPRGKQQHPSPNLQDLVTYLTNVTSAALVNSPDSIKNLLYSEALEHLGHRLKGLLLDKGQPMITDIALHNFDMDIKYLEDSIKGLGKLTVTDTFIELRQILDLALSPNSEDYLHPPARDRLYRRVASNDVLILFDKLLRDPSSQRTPRRRAMENVARVLHSVHIPSGR